MPNNIAILGIAPIAADLALRQVLRRNTSKGPVVILDYTGRGAAVLSRANMKDMPRHPIEWFDLADRQRPAAIFQLGKSAHFQTVVGRSLRLLRAVSDTQVRDDTIEWAAKAAAHLAQDGTVGLGALIRSLSSAEVRRWFNDAQPDPTDLARLIDLITWALRYPSVFALSEGNNRANLGPALRRSGTIWFEALAEHFESREHLLVTGLAEVVVEDAIRSHLTDFKESENHAPTVLHLFPCMEVTVPMTDWIAQTAGIVRHVSVHYLYPNRALKTATLAWVRSADELWIVGPCHRLASAGKDGWLTGEEIGTVERLRAGETWIRAAKTRQHVIARTGEPDVRIGSAHELRVGSARGRKTLTVRQMGSAFNDISEQNGRTVDLYAKLCEPEMLRAGWFRVQSARKDSCGVDKVTIQRFGDNLEHELKVLSDELCTRRYRCRPLLRIYIPKSDGTKRPLGICCVRDRVIQSACLQILEPAFEPNFSHFSFAFRPRRSALHALAVSKSMISSGGEWVVTADIKKCFDTIDHDVLLSLISRQLFDANLHALIRHWLTADVIDFSDFFPTELGVPQGETLSPLLSNIYLDPLDKHFEHLGIKFVRYADDILLFASTEEEAKTALGILESFLNDSLRLQLKPAKTNYSHASAGIDFFGFRVSVDRIEVQQSKLERAVEAIRESLQRLGGNASTFLQRSEALAAINAGVRGFRNYFAVVGQQTIEQQMRLLDGRIEEIAQRILPGEMRSDPAWIGRERFSLPQFDEMRGSQLAISGAASLQNDIYPQEESSTNPTAWVAGNGRDSNKASSVTKHSLLIEASEVSEEGAKPAPAGVVEYSGRLYVLAHGSYLTADEDCLVIKTRKVEIHRTALDELGLVFLQGFGMNISVNLQLRLAEMDIPVVFAPPVGGPMAVLNPVTSNRSCLRGQQVLRRDDPDVVRGGLKMLAAKVGNEAALLRYFAKYRKKTQHDIGDQLARAADTIRNLGDQLFALDPLTANVRAMAMGYEGHAAAIYWRHLVKLVPTEMNFNGRTTRHAPDPVNQCINYVYGILYGEVWRAIVKAGLDPYFGLMHGSQRDQGSLVFDLIEEFRPPFGDRLVFAMLGRGFRPEIRNDELLCMRSRALLAAAFSRGWSKKIMWRRRASTPAEILERQAASLAKLINRTGDYRPFRMKW